MAATQYVRAKDLLEAELGEELVALDVEGGHCFGFNSVAADIWHLLERPMDFDSLRQSLMNQYDVGEDECTDDLAEALAELQEKDLVRTVAAD